VVDVKKILFSLLHCNWLKILFSNVYWLIDLESFFRFFVPFLQPEIMDGECKCKKGICNQCNGCKSCRCECFVNNPRRSRRHTNRVRSYEEMMGGEEDANLAAIAIANEAIVSIPLESVLDVKKALNLSQNDMKNIPSAKNREEKKWNDLDDSSKRRLVQFTQKAVKSLCQIIYPKDFEALCKALGLELSHKAAPSEDKKLRDNTKQLIQSLPTSSVQRKVLEAAMAMSYSNEVLREEHEMGRFKATSSRRYFDFMTQENQELKVQKRTVRKYSAVAVTNAVDFVLNDANVQRISWGTKEVTIDGKTETFPHLIRKKAVRNMARDYLEHYPDVVDRVGLTSFEKIVRTITHHDQKAKEAVDYVSGQLLYDNLTMVRRIIDRNEDYDDKIRLQNIVNALDAYMKGRFENREHLGKCCYTQPSFAFDRTAGMIDDNCGVCALPLRVMEYLSSEVDPVHRPLMEDCREKLVLYMGHRTRVVNQREGIDAIMSSLTAMDAFIILDFKMKFEAKYFREKTTEWYGKKGLPWHGSMIYSLYTLSEKLEAEAEGKNLANFKINYCDHIATGDSMQDWFSVLSYFEAVLVQIKNVLPHVRRLFIQSDNAKCYRKIELLIGMVVVADKHGLEVKRFIHSGVQDGKSPLDGHFATAMRHVSMFCDEGNDIVTPEQLVNALRCNGGVRNSITELVGINRKAMDEFLIANDAKIEQLKHLKDQSDIHFDMDAKTLCVYQYANFGEGRVFHLEPSSNTSAEGTPEELDFAEASDEELNDDGDEIYISEPVVTDADDFLMEENEERLGHLGLQADIIGGITKCEITSGLCLNQHLRLERSGDKQQQPAEYLDVELDEPDPLQCVRCLRMFKTANGVEVHACDNIEGSNDLKSFALRYAFNQVDQNNFEVISASSTDQAEIFNCVPGHDHVVASFHGGWCCAKPHGQKYGKKYIGPYKQDVEQLFLEGCEDKSKRMGPGRMLNVLKSRYQDALDLPSETEIRQAISTLITKQKKGKPISLSRNRGIKSPFLDTIQEIVDQNPTIKPREALQLFKDIHTDASDDGYPTDKQIKSKISALKAKRNAQNA
jgi:hypothetical protein